MEIKSAIRRLLVADVVLRRMCKISIVSFAHAIENRNG